MPAPNRSQSRTRRGSVTLDWILLITFIILGTVGGVALVRNALIQEYKELLTTICNMSIGP